MATRPVFVPKRTLSAYVREVPVEFQWFPGMAPSQKQKSIAALHAAAKARIGVSRILEISSKSKERIGVKLSAFNLSLPLSSGRRVAVEVVYQASKRFERGGPFIDLLDGSSRDAKGDERLQTSGRLLSFQQDDDKWPLEPRTAYYDWLYLKALHANPDLAGQLLQYEAFTDIEFNPEKSVNCQARSAALFVSLEKEGLLERLLGSKKAFLAGFSGPSSESSQGRLL